MKHLYPKRFFIICFVSASLLLQVVKSEAQCPYGFLPGSTAYDTTIATPTGINTLEIKFPQADPLEGMVTCLRLCVSITGVVDSISIENNSASPQTADVYYMRTDQISGPGLTGTLSNSINHHYGPYVLGATDGVPTSGPDFMSITHDTLLNAVTLCQVITNLDSLFQFYGHDSVTYLYNISAFTNVSCTGGNYNSSVATSALVNIRFEYCTCPGYVLPLNIRDFTVEKQAENKALLSWSGFEDNSIPFSYHYEIQKSIDGKNFTAVGEVVSNPSGTNSYNFTYVTKPGENGFIYFRIRQVYSNGYSRLSEIKQIKLDGSVPPKFIIFPNPSNGNIGIKFANNQGDKKLLQIFNSQGQKVLQKEIEATGTYYLTSTLQAGAYWVKLTDMATQLSDVNQLFIK